jgi:DNA polymerase III epsilon subunit-like protein
MCRRTLLIAVLVMIRQGLAFGFRSYSHQFRSALLIVPRYGNSISKLSGTARFINVPFQDKDEVKNLGARWDKDKKQWFIPDGIPEAGFSKWLSGTTVAPVMPSTFVKASPVGMVDSSASKTYLNVPIAEKDEAKALGAKWDKDAKKWYYIADGVNDASFTKWISASSLAPKMSPKAAALAKPSSPAFESESSTNTFKIYLNVPLAEKDEAKALGAKWDIDAKKWYVPSGASPMTFAKWSSTSSFKPSRFVQNTEETFWAEPRSLSTSFSSPSMSKNAPVTNGGKIHLNVPFAQKDEAKALGAKWDKAEGKWFIPAEGTDLTPFSAWLTPQEAKPIDSTPTTVHQVEGTGQKWQRATPTAAAIEYPSPQDAVVLLSVDTNGLPLQDKGRYARYDDLKAYDPCRVIQISYNLCRKSDFQVVENGNLVVQADGFTIDNTEFHGISTETSKQEGLPFTEAAKQLFNVINKADNVLSHNGDFVFNILQSEFFRHGLLEELHKFQEKKLLCSMLMTVDALGLKDKAGNPKKPSLRELVKYASDKELPAQRGAPINIEALREALQGMSSKGEVSL